MLHQVLDQVVYQLVDQVVYHVVEQVLGHMVYHVVVSVVTPPPPWVVSGSYPKVGAWSPNYSG